jgi:hypothetical protein
MRHSLMFAAAAAIVLAAPVLALTESDLGLIPS